MTDPHILESYDEDIAASFLRTNETFAGLPDFLGLRLVKFEPGRLLAEMEVSEQLMTPFGNMHGGVISALCDHVLGCVCYPHMAKGGWAATTEFKVNLLAPVTGGKLEAVAELVSLTKSTAVVRIDVVNIDNTGEVNIHRACGAAQGTVTLRPPRPKA
ncbi:MAG: 1,4-dihydroxy-2-naphthoyl-CoA hydrolase [Myxococcota bacterium]|jgi:1,4-dihydroxy-2-naphthoyl-CoA hydrolase